MTLQDLQKHISSHQILLAKQWKRLILFNINFKNNENKLLSLACGCKNDIGILNKFDVNGVFMERS